MKLAIVIPARLGAVRLPRKPLRDLGGAPLVVRVLRNVLDLDLDASVVVATDADEIADAVRDAGGDVVMTPASCASGTERVAAAAGDDRFRDVDAFVNVQGDEPYLDGLFIRATVELLQSGQYSIATPAARATPEILDVSSIVKIVAGADGRALYFSRGPVPFVRDEDDVPKRDAAILQHVGVYGYTREALFDWISLPPHPLEEIERLEQLRPLAHGRSIGLAIVDAVPEGGIDTEEDLRVANERWPLFEAASLRMSEAVRR